MTLLDPRDTTARRDARSSCANMLEQISGSAALNFRKRLRQAEDEARMVQRGEAGLPDEQIRINRTERVKKVRENFRRELGRMISDQSKRMDNVRRGTHRERVNATERDRAWQRAKSMLDAGYSPQAVMKEADVAMLEGMAENMRAYLAAKSGPDPRTGRTSPPDTSGVEDMIRRRLAHVLNESGDDDLYTQVQAEDANAVLAEHYSALASEMDDAPSNDDAMRLARAVRPSVEERQRVAAQASVEGGSDGDD